MKNNMNVQFLCKDCENYNKCEYYYGRFGSSYICKYFHLPTKLNNPEKKGDKTMTIEEALEIIDNTNFYSYFTTEEQDEAFDTAFRALKCFRDYKEELKKLHLLKDHTAEALAAIFDNEIKKIEEGSGDDGN